MGKIRETFFISHGPPSMSTDESVPVRHFLKLWKQNTFSEKPNSILMISAHWDTSAPIVNVVNRPETIYDFYGLPDQFYQQKYPAPGAPELAKRVKDLLMSSGFNRVDEDSERGLDHGAWVPLMLMYPEADIPVCQLSLQSKKNGTYHYNMGKALASLKDEGVLIIGSGSATHNLTVLQRGTSSVVPWAQEFDTWIKDALLNGRYEDVNNYEKKAPHAKMAHPCPDHFYPLHVAMGAAGENAEAKLIHDSWDLGALSYASYSFTSTTRL